MTSILLMLLLSVIRAQRMPRVPSCPAASCVVCSEDALICHRLAHIIDAPDSTQALLLTDGSISTVQPASLSDLSNVTLIGLSHNHISVLGDQSFRNLQFLQTLLLDHNLLTSQALQGGALTNLTQLQVLALGHNLISMIQGSWLEGSRALRSLKLEGNLISSLDSGSFPSNDLRDLESLDLSDNLIDHLHRNSFVRLVSLQTLDLSRNRLTSAPAETFSYLSWLTNFNLDLNSWNCSCQLLDLVDFLSAYMQQPDKTLYNGRRMLCVSADNPAVTTVLELTEANCVPSNQNITVQVEARGGVTPQRYARDVAVAAVICFIGGVVLTLLVVLIVHRTSLKGNQRQKEEREDVAENRKDVLLQTQRRHPWERDSVTLDGPFRSRADESCPDCNGQRGTATRWTMREEEKIISRDIPSKRLHHGNNNSSSHHREVRPETLAAHQTTRDVFRGHEVLHCESCHRTFRPGSTHANAKDPPMFNGIPSQHRRHDQFDEVTANGLKRETRRNVTFDLETTGSQGGEDKDRGRARRQKVQSSRAVKVKLNLNPLKKSRVHPKRKSEVEKKERSLPRKREKRQDGGEKDGKVKKKKASKENKMSSEQHTAEDANPQPADATNTPEQPASGPAGELGQNQQGSGVQYQGPGSVLGSVQLRNHPTNLSTFSSAGSQLTGRGFAFQGGSFSLSASGSNVAFPGGPAGSAGPGLAVSGPNLAPGGALDSFGRQAGVGLVSPATSLLATLHAKPMLSTAGVATGLAAANPMLTTTGVGSGLAAANPMLTTTGVATGLAAANPMLTTTGVATGLAAANPMLTTTGVGSGLAANAPMQPDPAQVGPGGLQPGEGVQSLTLPAPSVDVLSGVTPPGPGSTVENLSNNNSQMETGGSTGGGDPAEGLPGGSLSGPGLGPGSGVSEPGPGVSGPGPSPSPAAGLVQQEFLSEDGGSTPRRKLRLVLPEKTSGRPPTALERKIR